MWETRTRGSLLLNEVAISVCHNIDTKDPVREDFNMIMTWLTSSIFQESGSHCRDSTKRFVRESCCTSMPPSTGMVCLCDTATFIPKPLISACAGFNPQAGMRLRWGGWRPSLGELGGGGLLPSAPEMMSLMQMISLYNVHVCTRVVTVTVLALAASLIHCQQSGWG